MEVGSRSSDWEALLSSNMQSSFSSSSSGDSSPHEANNCPEISWDEWGYFPEAFRAHQHPAEGSGNYWPPPLHTVHPAAHRQQQYFGTGHERTTTLAGYQQHTKDYATPRFFTQGNYNDSRVSYEYCQPTTTYHTAPSMHVAEGYQEAATASSTSTTPAEEDHHEDSDTWVQDLVELDVKPFPVPLPVPVLVMDPHPAPDPVYASVPVENEHSHNGQSDVDAREEQPISSQVSEYSTNSGNPEDIIHQCVYCSRLCVSAVGLKSHLRYCKRLRLVSQVGKPDSRNGTAGQTSDTREQQPQQQQQKEIQQSEQPDLQQQQQQPAFVNALRRSALRVMGEKLAARTKSGEKRAARTKSGEKRVARTKSGEKRAARTKSGEKRAARTKSGAKQHACSVCGVRFHREGALLKHLAAHDSVRPYVCTVCDKSYCSNAALRKHARLHNIPRPFTCPICQACFASKDTLLLHTQTHTDDVCFCCSQCSSSFSDVTKLQLHVLQQHREQQQIVALLTSTSSRSFCCNDCSKSFSTQRLLLVHGVSHATRGSRLACHVCKRSYVYPGGLLRHLHIRHRYSDSDAEQCLLRLGTSVKQLEKNITDLLNLVFEPQVLVDLGYPLTRPGLLLDSVLRRCGQHPAANNDYVQQLLANTKMLFQYIMEDQILAEDLFQRYEVNDVLQLAISLARTNQNPQ